MNPKSNIKVITFPNKIQFDSYSELLKFKDFFLLICWRNIITRYKQTFVGIVWVLIQPIINLIVLTLVFNRMANLQSGSNLPYPVFLLIGLVFWQFFSTALSFSSNSLIDNSDSIRKIYFPRIFLPLASIFALLIDLIIMLFLLSALICFYGFKFSISDFPCLFILIITVILYVTGFGLLFSAINVKYRDLRFVIPFFLQVLFYLTPIVYPLQIIDNHPFMKTIIIWFNPLVGVISITRDLLLQPLQLDIGLVSISFFISLVYFILGYVFFKSKEPFFADII